MTTSTSIIIGAATHGELPDRDLFSRLLTRASALTVSDFGNDTDEEWTVKTPRVDICSKRWYIEANVTTAKPIDTSQFWFTAWSAHYPELQLVLEVEVDEDVYSHDITVWSAGVNRTRAASTFLPPVVVDSLVEALDTHRDVTSREHTDADELEALRDLADLLRAALHTA